MNDTITVAEAAAILGVSEGYTRRLLRNKIIESRKAARESESRGPWLVSRASVEQYVAAHKKRGEQ